MIITKAIELQEFHYRQLCTETDPDLSLSTKLGLEALKRIEDARLHPFHPVHSPLPGETMPERGIN